MVFTCSVDKTGAVWDSIKVWDIRQGDVTYSLSGHTDTVTGLRVSPNDHYLLSNAMDDTVRIWDRTSVICNRMLLMSVS